MKYKLITKYDFDSREKARKYIESLGLSMEFFNWLEIEDDVMTERTMKSKEQIKDKIESLTKLLNNDLTEIEEIKTWQWIDALRWAIERGEFYDNYECKCYLDESECCEGYYPSKDLCNSHPNCYYKQLKLALEENEELKKINNDLWLKARNNELCELSGKCFFDTKHRCNYFNDFMETKQKLEKIKEECISAPMVDTEFSLRILDILEEKE